jgi:hypothetical protein
MPRRRPPHGQRMRAARALLLFCAKGSTSGDRDVASARGGGRTAGAGGRHARGLRHGGDVAAAMWRRGSGGAADDVGIAPTPSKSELAAD